MAARDAPRRDGHADRRCRPAALRDVEGEDAATLEAAFAAANQLTQWVDAGGDPADAVSIAVRPLLPGDDPCMDLFGVDG